MVSGKGVSIQGDIVKKKFKSDKPYQNELYVYKMGLSYIPKLISNDDEKYYPK